MGNDKKLLLVAGGVVAGVTGIWALLRWRKYRVLFEPIQTADGVTIKKMVKPLPRKEEGVARPDVAARHVDIKAHLTAIDVETSQKDQRGEPRSSDPASRCTTSFTKKPERATTWALGVP
jgi:hypothetical protein